MEFDLGKVRGEDGATPELAHTIGDSVDKAMTQKAITDQFAKMFTGVGVCNNAGGIGVFNTNNKSAFFIFAAYEKDTQNYVIALGVRPDGTGTSALPKYTVIANNTLEIAGVSASGNIMVKNFTEYVNVRSMCYFKTFEE